MQLYHKSPCKECPWRLESPAGWLGGHPALYYADAVNNNEVPACHRQDHGPDSDNTAMCAGALATMANQCKLVHTVNGEQARQEVGKNEQCFRHVGQFFLHHTGQAYVHPMLRRRSYED